ncbi:unnamed protein product, partial [marine sediment metagenome]
GKHFCEKKDCEIELPWASGSFHKFKVEYKVDSTLNGKSFYLELCTNCETELAEKLASLMNKYYVAPEITYI